MSNDRLQSEVVFYEQIAAMFYAVLMSDNSFHRQEAVRLNDVLKKHFLEADTGNILNTEEAMMLIRKKTGDLLVSQENALDKLEAFRQYRNLNQTYFTPEIQQALWKAANALAYAAAGQNKSELIVLQELKQILHQPI